MTTISSPLFGDPNPIVCRERMYPQRQGYFTECKARRVDDLEGELEAMDLGRNQPNLEAEIDALAKDDVLNEELEALRASMDKAPKA